MTPKTLKNNFEKRFDKAVSENYRGNDPYWPDWEGVKSFFHSQIDLIIEKTKEDMKENITKKLLKTHKESYAFMVMNDKEGKLEDWFIPISEVLKILEAKNN